MKRAILALLILVTSVFLTSSGAWGAEEFPRPTGAVNDFAGLIPQTDRQNMEILATEVLQKTGTAVVVATVPTVGDSDVAI